MYTPFHNCFWCKCFQSIISFVGFFSHLWLGWGTSKQAQASSWRYWICILNVFLFLIDGALSWLQISIMSLYIGIVFFCVHNDPNQLDLNLLKIVFFISLLNLTLFNLRQLPGLLDKCALYYKQQDAHFYCLQSYLFAKLLGVSVYTFGGEFVALLSRS